jgi:nitrite reductase/ring-hydroxylating ferredoxin subunit
MQKIPLFKTSELAPGKIRRVSIGNMAPIAVYNLGGEFLATDDTCTHGAASLSEGDIEGDCVICPYHAGSFDIRSGEAREQPCWEPLDTHPLTVKDGVIYLLRAPCDEAEP